MTTEQVLSYIGVLGLGGIIGVVLKSVVDYKISNREMLFKARVKAYAGIIGRVFNLFLEPDITILKEDALIFAKINALLSEVFLLGSHTLVNFIGEFKVKVNEFHSKLSKKDDKNIEELHKNLVELSGKISDQMRKDIYVSSKSLWK